MRTVWLATLFVLLMILQGVFLTEAFGTSPGTLIQLTANHPAYFLARAKDYSQ